MDGEIQNISGENTEDVKTTYWKECAVYISIKLPCFLKWNDHFLIKNGTFVKQSREQTGFVNIYSPDVLVNDNFN